MQPSENREYNYYLKHLLRIKTPTYAFRLFKFTECKINRYCDPLPRSGHRIVADDLALYCFGGFNPNVRGNLVKELCRYEFLTEQWKVARVISVPEVFVSGSLILWNCKLIVFGGTGDPFGEMCSNTLNIFDLKEKETFQAMGVSNSPPIPQYGQGIYLVGNILYSIGGTTGFEFTSDVHAINLKTGVWDHVYQSTGDVNEPVGRYKHEVACDGANLYLLGGCTRDSTIGFEELPVFNLRKKSWYSIKTFPDSNVPSHGGFPCPRKYHSSVQLQNSLNVIIIGGYGETEPLNDSWLLNLESMKWTRLSGMTLPQNTYFHDSTVTPSGKVYSFGGVVHVDDFPVRSNKLYSAWITIPSLKVMCWDALKHYEIPTKGLDLYCNFLKKVGVPFEFREKRTSWPVMIYKL